MYSSGTEIRNALIRFADPEGRKSLEEGVWEACAVFGVVLGILSEIYAHKFDILPFFLRLRSVSRPVMQALSHTTPAAKPAITSLK